jgi:hypothetical protein
MKKRFNIVFLAVIIVTVLLAGCAQAASSGIDQTTGAATGVSEQQPASQSNAATTDTSKNTAATAPAAATPVNRDNSPSMVKISDILQNSKTYDGKTVMVQGKIVTECGSGCWFTLKEGTAVIYIDLAPNNMVIPQKRGSDAKVTAKVVSEGSDVYLIGSKVEF